MASRKMGLAVKRALDLIAASVGLVMLSPVLGTAALAIIVSSGRPIFFRQERVGRNMRPFYIWKFRTMRTDAEMRGPRVTARNDQRITAVGRLLRKTKLDELPQLWNVLIGDMSLVGPRPEVPKYVSYFNDRFRRVLVNRPGLTDPASIVFRDEQRFLDNSDPESAYIRRILPRKLAMYERYTERACLAYDIRLIATTVCRLAVHARA